MKNSMISLFFCKVDIIFEKKSLILNQLSIWMIFQITLVWDKKNTNNFLKNFCNYIIRSFKLTLSSYRSVLATETHLPPYLYLQKLDNLKRILQTFLWKSVRYLRSYDFHRLYTSSDILAP